VVAPPAGSADGIVDSGGGKVDGASGWWERWIDSIATVERTPLDNSLNDN
jgi:hypothetical protein